MSCLPSGLVVVVTYSNAHYGNPEFILTPVGEEHGDGWETARRVPGNEWIIIRLGRIGIIERLEIDTAHFKGNYLGMHATGGLVSALQEEALVAQAMFWDEVRLQRTDRRLRSLF